MTAGEFDPIKAQRDIVASADQVYLAVRQWSRGAQQRLAEAEKDRTASAMLETWVKQALDAEREKLHQLIWSAENAARGTP